MINFKVYFKLKKILSHKENTLEAIKDIIIWLVRGFISAATIRIKRQK